MAKLVALFTRLQMQLLKSKFGDREKACLYVSYNVTVWGIGSKKRKDSGNHGKQSVENLIGCLQKVILTILEYLRVISPLG